MRFSSAASMMSILLVALFLGGYQFLGAHRLQIDATAPCPNLIRSSRPDSGKIGPRLQYGFEISSKTKNLPDSSGLYTVWVYFTDKGSQALIDSYKPSDVVSKRSLARRAKVRTADNLIDCTDLLVNYLYVREVASRVTRVRHSSRWMNAVSIQADSAEIIAVSNLPFVEFVESFTGYTKTNSSNDGREGSRDELIMFYGSDPLPFDYGKSLGQIAQLNVHKMHKRGVYGQGVLIGIFDSGFRTLEHPVFDSLRVIAQYDFVDSDPYPTRQPGEPIMGDHGMQTLSTIGGFAPGKLIGSAFGAEFVLARTEDGFSETPLEEDNWIVAIEWADSIGIDIATTSLGYLGYDDPYRGWTWEDLDGNTTLITQASDMAVSKGIFVVTSAGNTPAERDDRGIRSSEIVNTLGAPADGDSVLAVGAVDLSGNLVYFSSVGPQAGANGRIKPNVVALGYGVRVAAVSDSLYKWAAGTSFSGPLVAGVAALLLSENPQATPMQLMEALEKTASMAAKPGNEYGYGIPNADAASKLLAP